MKPANSKHWQLRRKLQALAAAGIAGEKTSAAHKLEKLESRIDFSEPENVADLFATCQPENGYEPAPDYMQLVAVFTPAESKLGSFTKWAIEKGTGMRGKWKPRGFDMELCMECSPSTTPALMRIAEVIRHSFTGLWQAFAAVPGAKPSDAGNFMLGLYDGMMADNWTPGKPLPKATEPKARKMRAKKRTLAVAPGVSLHAYSVAVELGRKIRLVTPLDEIAGELNDAVKALATA